MSIDFDEEKRRLQQMNILAVEKLKEKQELDYEPKKQVRDVKKLLVTIGFVIAAFLILTMISQSMNS